MGPPPKAPLTRLIHAVSGARVGIEAVVLADGSCPAEVFLDALGPADAAKLMALFDLFVRRFPQPMSREKFKKIEGTAGLFEFKSFQIRLPCFFRPGGRLLLTHGLIKKADRLPPQEIARAHAIQAAYEEQERNDG
jgi:hypothetical protein